MASHRRHLIHCNLQNPDRGFRATAAFFLPYLPRGALDDSPLRGVDWRFVRGDGADRRGRERHNDAENKRDIILRAFCSPRGRAGAFFPKFY